MVDASYIWRGIFWNRCAVFLPCIWFLRRVTLFGWRIVRADCAEARADIVSTVPYLESAVCRIRAGDDLRRRSDGTSPNRNEYPGDRVALAEFVRLVSVLGTVFGANMVYSWIASDCIGVASPAGAFDQEWMVDAGDSVSCHVFHNGVLPIRKHVLQVLEMDCSDNGFLLFRFGDVAEAASCSGQPWAKVGICRIAVWCCGSINRGLSSLSWSGMSSLLAGYYDPTRNGRRLVFDSANPLTGLLERHGVSYLCSPLFLHHSCFLREP